MPVSKSFLFLLVLMMVQINVLDGRSREDFNRDLREEKLMYYDNSDKIWVHRVNSVERLKILQPYYDGFEVDLVYVEKDDVFSVSHSTRKLSKLTLEKILETYVKRPGSGIWLDIKNLRVSNADRIFERLEHLVSEFNLKRDRIVVESSDIKSLSKFTKAGYVTSYYLPSRLLREVLDSGEEKGLEKRLAERMETLNRNIKNSDINAVSCDCRYIGIVKEYLPYSPAIFLWGPRLSYLNKEHRKIISKIFEDHPEVKLFLVGDRTQFYR